jgi:hypothetical protein
MTFVVEGPRQAPDLLAEATGGKLHWNDAGMDAKVTDGLGFALDMRVEVRTATGWHKGTVRRIPEGPFHEFIVECDEPQHRSLDFYNGKGVTISAIDNTVRGVLSNLRKLV